MTTSSLPFNRSQTLLYVKYTKNLALQMEWQLLMTNNDYAPKRKHTTTTKTHSNTKNGTFRIT